MHQVRQVHIRKPPSCQHTREMFPITGRKEQFHIHGQEDTLPIPIALIDTEHKGLIPKLVDAMAKRYIPLFNIRRSYTTDILLFFSGGSAGETSVTGFRSGYGMKTGIGRCGRSLSRW